MRTIPDLASETTPFILAVLKAVPWPHSCQRESEGEPQKAPQAGQNRAERDAPARHQVLHDLARRSGRTPLSCRQPALNGAFGVGSTVFATGVACGIRHDPS